MEETAREKTVFKTLEDCEGNEFPVSFIPAIHYVTDKIG